MSEINYELLEQMINCVKREVKLRYAVYPKRIKSGLMTQKEATREQQLMYAVQKALQKIYDGTAPKPVQLAFLNSQDYIKPKNYYL